MKAIYAVYAPPLDCQVMSAMKKAGIKKYSKYPMLHGVGGHSEPHLDSQIWPGTNMALLIITDEKIKTQFLAEVAAIKKDNLEEGIKAFVWNVEEEV